VSDSDVSIPLSPFEILARNHALLCSIGFLIILPIGALIPRYTRTLPYKWFHAHWPIQLFIAAPIIFAGWALGKQTTAMLETPDYQDTHQKIGLCLLILFVLQLAFGAFAHFFKFSTFFHGHRAPHSYFHVAFGLIIILLAQYQVNYGLYTEWDFATGGLHQVPDSAKHAWLAVLVIFWPLYILGLALVPRQYNQERKSREAAREGSDTGGQKFQAGSEVKNSQP